MSKEASCSIQGKKTIAFLCNRQKYKVEKRAMNYGNKETKIQKVN